MDSKAEDEKVKEDLARLIADMVIDEGADQFLKGAVDKEWEEQSRARREPLLIAILTGLFTAAAFEFFRIFDVSPEVLFTIICGLLGAIVALAFMPPKVLRDWVTRRRRKKAIAELDPKLREEARELIVKQLLSKKEATDGTCMGEDQKE